MKIGDLVKIKPVWMNDLGSPSSEIPVGMFLEYTNITKKKRAFVYVNNEKWTVPVFRLEVISESR